MNLGISLKIVRFFLFLRIVLIINIGVILKIIFLKFNLIFLSKTNDLKINKFET